MSETSPEDRVPLVRRPLFWLVVVAVLLAAAVVTSVVVTATGGPGDDAPTQTPTPTPTTPQPTATTEPSPSSPAPTPTEASPAPRAIPDSCDGIYTRDWDAELGVLVLNPAWTDAEPPWGSNDRDAVTMLQATSELRCAWVTDSPGDAGIITNVASLTPEQSQTMEEHFADAGFTCYEELSGTRCVIEEETEAGEWGESHFLREGVWIATRWANVTADGYTHDIVAAIFG